VTVAVGATVRTARQLIHPVREDMLLSPPNSPCNLHPFTLPTELIVFFDLKPQNKNCFQAGAEVLIISPNVKIYQEYIL
jgi:hypothetical protein